MLQFFLNPWALLGLSGVGLAVVAHLISRRRFDIVPWGAMQFLNPGRKTRRKLKLEELLLMLIRMAMIAVFALAVTRPWLPSGWLSGYRSSGSRCVVLVIDGSNSMGRGDGLNTLHQNARRRVVEFLGTLSPGDRVALIDARDQPRTIIESPLQDHRLVAEAIEQLPEPAGAANLPAAVEQAVAILAGSSAGAREVMILTDRQRAGWHPEQDELWERIDDLLDFPGVRPHIWAMDVSAGLTAIQSNIAVGKLQLSRDLTVPDFPVRVSATLQNSGAADQDIPVGLLLDGQPLAASAQQVSVPARSRASVQFEIVISSPGTHLISVRAEASDDMIRADNISHAAVHLSSALPVLIVNGHPSNVPAERETFFAETALQAFGTAAPWLSVQRIDAADVRPQDIRQSAMVILADVADLPAAVPPVLVEFADSGGGILISLGPNTTVESFERLYRQPGLLSRVQLVRRREAPADITKEVNVAQTSLQAGWLDRFRSNTARSFLKARFQQWWLTVLPSVDDVSAELPLPPLPLSDEAVTGGKRSDERGPPDSGVQHVATPTILAALSTGDPLMIQTASERGSVLLLTTTLSRRWNNLPTTADYVPFLFEAIFQAASSRVQRNVEFGMPLVVSVPVSSRPGPVDVEAAGFRAPDKKFLPGKRTGDSIADSAAAAPGSENAGGSAVLSGSDSEQPVGASERVLLQTTLPGIYQLLSSPPVDGNEPAPESVLDQFVVNYDHSEDDMTELTADDRARLKAHDRVHFVDSMTALLQQMYGQESRTELWAVLICLFPCLLLLELFVTRRLIQKGFSDAGAASQL